MKDGAWMVVIPLNRVKVSTHVLFNNVLKGIRYGRNPLKSGQGFNENSGIEKIYPASGVVIPLNRVKVSTYFGYDAKYQGSQCRNPLKSGQGFNIITYLDKATKN